MADDHIEGDRPNPPEPDGLAIAALVTGGVGAVVGVTASLYDYWFPLAAGAAAVVLGWLSRGRGGPQMATWGLALGIVSLCIGVYGAVEWDNDLEGEPLFVEEEEAETETKNTSLGQPLTLAVDDISLRVTPERVIDPVPLGEYETPEPGSRTVGVLLRVDNTADKPFDEPLDPRLLTADGRESQTTFVSGGECSDTVPETIPPGESRRFCIPYSVRRRARLDRMQLTVERLGSFEGNQVIGVWKIRP